MYAVIFEVEPEPERRQEYLDIAARLRPELEKIDGFVSIERFQSLTNEGKILSLSIWRDEDAITRWRSHQQHHEAQLAGRGGIFRDYRLRVAAIVRDYGMTDRDEAPQRMADPPPRRG
ncbi:MAG TPA: antibiotic biosynthesis monooxygenase [Stellaceae bacterium]|nr:antibiotic biosynthesis monooxygenase [Stellaceae bacterium]